jgi:transposase InsO family protein
LSDQDVANTSEICDVLDIHRSGYYQWNSQETSASDVADQALIPKVNAIFNAHKRRYGSRRIVATLADEHEHVGRKRVAKIMKIQGLKAIQPKSFKPKGTQSRHRLGYSPNLLLDADAVSQCNRLWVGDITYIHIKEIGFGYLSILMDRYSRRIVGWMLGSDLTDALVLETIRMSIANRQPKQGLMHHSDRGSQYAAKSYRAVLKRAGMIQSMSRAGNCYDNAFMESCFGTLKTELEMVEYTNMRIATNEISQFIDYYNTKRKHSSLGYLTPSQFESNQASQN